MKKILCVILALLMLLSMAGCGNSNGDAPQNESTEASNRQNNEPANTANGESYDVDLTKLSSTMIYSEVYNMMAYPDDYLEKTVRMRGNFGVYQDQATGKLYYACLIADATSCCSQGIEFVLEGDYTYPDDYPEINSVITVTGLFDTYEENGYTYCQLIHAKME